MKIFEKSNSRKRKYEKAVGELEAPICDSKRRELPRCYSVPSLISYPWNSDESTRPTSELFAEVNSISTGNSSSMEIYTMFEPSSQESLELSQIEESSESSYSDSTELLPQSYESEEFMIITPEKNSLFFTVTPPIFSKVIRSKIKRKKRELKKKIEAKTLKLKKLKLKRPKFISMIARGSHNSSKDGYEQILEDEDDEPNEVEPIFNDEPKDLLQKIFVKRTRNIFALFNHF